MSLKKFEILEMIAKGGMAEVYRAKTVGFQGFEKEVCVKKILPHLTEDESFVTMFINEAKLAATLNYANIVQVHDLCVSAGGEYFIVMEYVNGKDLSDMIRAAQLAGREIPPDIAVYIIREACKALYYAHNKSDPDGARLKIIHRDISPHNVLVSFMGEIKLTDFGIAKAANIMNKTAVGILKGKYGYMSPEQARGQPLDHRSDIFNTGIVLYELLVGERCFAGSSDFSTLNLMRNAEVTPPTKINSSIPKGLEEIVLRCLSLDRKDRFQDAMELERALGKFAKSTMSIATASELSFFMKELFANIEERKPDSSTGLLSLESVVGPPPQSPDEKAKSQVVKSPPKTPEAPVLAGKSEPGKEALARAKRKATKAKPEAAPKAATPEVSPPEPEKKATPEKKSEKVEKPAKAKPVKAETPKADAPKAETPKRKPARVKASAAPPEKKKRKGKQDTSKPKKPVGKKELRPGLTQIRALQGGPRKSAFLKAAVYIVIAGGIGLGLGYYRAGQISNQKQFRDEEMASLDTPKSGTVMVLVESDPPGATVRFDNLELSEVTPLAIERDQDDKEHTIEFTLRRYKSATQTTKYSTDGTLNRITQKLEGHPGTLKLTSSPDGQPVKLNGEDIGKTPIERDIPWGKHKLEIGGGERELIKQEVMVRAGKATTLEVPVPRKGAMGTLSLSSSPKAQIFINGRSTGQWTGEGELTLPPEIEHRVTLRGADSKTQRDITIKLGRGEKKKIFLDLTQAS